MDWNPKVRRFEEALAEAIAPLIERYNNPAPYGSVFVTERSVSLSQNWVDIDTTEYPVICPKCEVNVDGVMVTATQRDVQTYDIEFS